MECFSLKTLYHQGSWWFPLIVLANFYETHTDTQIALFTVLTIYVGLNITAAE